MTSGWRREKISGGITGIISVTFADRKLPMNAYGINLKIYSKSSKEITRVITWWHSREIFKGTAWEISG